MGMAALGISACRPIITCANLGLNREGNERKEDRMAVTYSQIPPMEIRGLFNSNLRIRLSIHSKIPTIAIGRFFQFQTSDAATR
jgi:hypothetical protein